jgi:hypothetical protein
MFSLANGFFVRGVPDNMPLEQYGDKAILVPHALHVGLRSVICVTLCLFASNSDRFGQ